jgi:hypothetical protein
MNAYISISGIAKNIKDNSREDIMPILWLMRVAISILIKAVNMPIETGSPGGIRAKVSTKKILRVKTIEAMRSM